MTRQWLFIMGEHAFSQILRNVSVILLNYPIIRDIILIESLLAYTLLNTLADII